jgi:TolB-like protein/two-component SAPR family response regulator/Flp pilus assembly protein TadD
LREFAVVSIGKNAFTLKKTLPAEAKENYVAVLEVTLFGGFEVRLVDGDVRDLPGQKDRALLAILALQPGATHSRDKLASLLWSDRGDGQARDSLKHAVARLRKCLAPADSAPIVADRQSVRLDPAAMTVDVTTFERLVMDGAPEAIEQAMALYGGDFLDGISIRDPVFEDWLLIERQRLRDMMEEAAASLMRSSAKAGASKQAAAAARRLLSLDPLREEACRNLMQIHTDHGETAQALKLYETLRDRLHRELGVKPEPETIQLYETIKQRQDGPAPNDVDPGANGEDAPVSVQLSLPDKPSIAVLAFENLSGDPEQEYFTDGIVEEIITALSRMSWLFVIARNSSFTYKGRAVDIKQVGRELGVRYVLEGSVRRAADRLRITGQLVEASTGVHLWADRFDGDLKDIFDLQDRVASSVIGAIGPKLEQAEIERAKRKPTERLDAYDYYLRAMASVYRWTKDGVEDGLRLCNKAIDLDPEFAAAHGVAAWCYFWRMANGWMSDREQETAEVTRLARRAQESGRDDAVALSFGGLALGYVTGDAETGIAMCDRALMLNPNLAAAWGASGHLRACHGDPDLAVEQLARAMRLSPLDPQLFFMQSFTAFAHFIAGRFDEAWPLAEAATREQPYYLSGVRIAAVCNIRAGRQDEARRHIARALRLDPELRISNLRDRVGQIRQEYFEKYVEALRLAGLPE